MFYSFNFLFIGSNIRKWKNKTLLMFYTSIFLAFEWDEMYRYVFYTYIFLERKISITSKMFYFLDTPVYVFGYQAVIKRKRGGDNKSIDFSIIKNTLTIPRCLPLKSFQNWVTVLTNLDHSLSQIIIVEWLIDTFYLCFKLMETHWYHAVFPPLYSTYSPLLIKINCITLKNTTF